VSTPVLCRRDFNRRFYGLKPVDGRARLNQFLPVADIEEVSDDEEEEEEADSPKKEKKGKEKAKKVKKEKSKADKKDPNLLRMLLYFYAIA
jgi:hypothetical protein